MERIAGVLSDVLVAKDIVEPEDRDFYRYAIESLLIICINLFTMLGLAILIGKAAECLFFLMVFSPLRSHSGGLHMKTWYSCYFVSCCLVEIVLLLSGKIVIGWGMLLFIFALCGLIIWFYRPCVNEKHPMKEADISRNRVYVRVYCILLFVLAICLKGFGCEVWVMLCTSAVMLNAGLLVGESVRYKDIEK